MSGSIPAWAYRGAKVICIDDSPHKHASGVVRLRQGQEYTVRATRQMGGCAGVWLEEVTNRMSIRGIEYGYFITRFRPIITQQDDISTHFAQYLNAPHKPVREGV